MFLSLSLSLSLACVHSYRYLSHLLYLSLYLVRSIYLSACLSLSLYVSLSLSLSPSSVQKSALDFGSCLTLITARMCLYKLYIFILRITLLLHHRSQVHVHDLRMYLDAREEEKEAARRPLERRRGAGGAFGSGTGTTF